MVKKHKSLLLPALIILLALAAYHTTYTIHEKYSLPFHSDEWDHLTLALHLSKVGNIESIRTYNPYTNTPYKANREIGYHLLLALLYQACGLTEIQFAVTTPTVFAFILAFSTLALARHITKSTLAGVIAAIFSLTLKSNVTILGIWFLVPMALGITLAPIILYTLARALNHEKDVNTFDLTFILIVATTLLIHPPSATVYIPITIAYLAYNWEITLAKKRKLAYYATAAILTTLAFLLITKVPLSSLTNPLYFIKQYLYFGSSDYEIQATYAYPTYLGKTILLLSAAGVYHTIHSNEKKERILPLTVLALLPLVAQYYNTQHVLFSTYRRVFMYTAAMILILSAVGLYYLYATITSLIKKTTKDKMFTALTQVALLAIIVFIVTAQLNTTFKYKQRLYHLIEESDVQPIRWLSENTPEDSVIVARSHTSQAITPLSQRHVVGIQRTMLRSTQERTGDANHFFQPDCDCVCKKKRIDKYNITHVYGKEKHSCPFLKKVYTKNSVKIYEVTTSNLST